jgi:hypothetical protein
MNFHNSIVYRIIEFGMSRTVFTKVELFVSLGLTNEHGQAIDGDAQLRIDHISSYFVCCDPKTVASNHVIGEVRRSPHELQNQYSLLPSAIMQYEDYLEIKGARQNAEQARRFSIIAIGVSAIGLFVAFAQLVAQLADA